MFGYVKAYKPEMRVKEYEMYKAVYCSICKQIGREYGIVTRFSLSYDFTFLTMLCLSVSDDYIDICKGKCVCNPLKKCNFVKASLPKMPLAASQIMLYYKLTDNIEDEGFIKSIMARLLRLFVKKGFKKAADEFPKLADIFKEYFKAQQDIEKENVQDIDKAADPTAKMLSSLFILCGTEKDKRALERLGYCMGRWIYILDAAADLKEDIRKNKYNPLSSEGRAQNNLTAFAKNKLEGSLNICITEAAAAFELIDILRFKNILGNIIYLGLENSQKEVLNKGEISR